jgi:hypothetical protein
LSPFGHGEQKTLSSASILDLLSQQSGQVTECHSGQGRRDKVDLVKDFKQNKPNEQHSIAHVHTLLFESTSRPLTTLISDSSCGTVDASVNIRLLVFEYCVRCNVAPRSESTCNPKPEIESAILHSKHRPRIKEPSTHEGSQTASNRSPSQQEQE